MNSISLKLNADPLILSALREDISSEDVSTNAVMPAAVQGQVQLIAKQAGIIAGLSVFERVFYLLDSASKCTFTVKDGDKVLFVNEGNKIIMMNASINALLEAQQAFTGVAEELGIESEQDVVDMVNEIREERSALYK